MTFIPSSVEVAFLWNIEHGLLGQPVQQYLADHPDHEDALLRIFRLGGNDLVKDLIERGADVATFQPAAPEPAPLAPLTSAEALLIAQLRDGCTDEAAETLAGLLTPAPKPSWREQVKNPEHYLLAFALAGALVRNGVVEVDLYDPRWHRTFENIVSTVEDTLNLFNT